MSAVFDIMSRGLGDYEVDTKVLDIMNHVPDNMGIFNQGVLTSLGYHMA